MAGGLAYGLLGAVAPIRPRSTYRTHEKILYLHSKSTCNFWIRSQRPHQNPFSAPKTQPSVWVRSPTNKNTVPAAGGGGTNLDFFSLRNLTNSFDKGVKVIAAIAKLKPRAVLEEIALFVFLLFAGIERIKKELERMQCILNQQNTVEGSEDSIDRVSFEIRDVIDDIDTFSQIAQRARLGAVGRDKIFISLQIIARITVAAYRVFKMRLKIRDIFIKWDFSGILKEINEGRQEASSSIQSLQDHRRSFAEEEEPEVVVGLQDKIDSLKQQLTSEELSRCVIPIVGMAGSGKTTIAKKVYLDVKDAFDCRAFVYFSRQYEIKDALMRIIKDVMGLSEEETQKLTEEKLRGMLCDHLEKKRYLVVLDDIWSIEAWKKLALALPNVSNKSRVVLTTRIEEVASYAVESNPLVEMRLLDDNEGWELFMSKIFGRKNLSTVQLSPSEKENLRLILEKCGNLPLAIVALGGILKRRDKTLNEWSKFLGIANYHLTEGSEGCMKVLDLSYWDLPFYLRPCFLYFGLFPQNYEIDSAKLIQLWIAEGFIQHRIHKIIEDDAEEYLKELVRRSMILVSWKQSDGSLGGCRIHDLFRKLSILKAKRNNFFTIHDADGTCSLPDNIRRLALYQSLDGYHPTNTLRSILSFCSFDLSQLDFGKAKLMRVVCELHEELPKPFGDQKPESGVTLTEHDRELIHLRYLELQASASLLYPIGDLSNLQTLILKSSSTPLGNEIAKLKQLRRLEGFVVKDGKGNLPLKNLTNLQTLRLVSHSDGWIEDDLSKLTTLRELSIAGSFLDSHNKLLSASIDKLTNLRSLALWNSSDQTYLPLFIPFRNHLHLYRMELNGRIKELPEFPPILSTLILQDSELGEVAFSTLEKLPHLMVLKLIGRSYLPEKMICSSRGFPKLESLELTNSPLEELILEKGAVPCLKSIVLRDMLRNWTVSATSS